MAVCQDDLDCPSFQLCYQNTSASWLDGQTKCLCNTEYGWTGVDCSGFGPATQFGIVFNAILLAFDAIGWLFGLFILYELFRVKKLKLNSMGFTLVFCIIQFTLQVVRDALVLTVFHTPDWQTETLTIQGTRVLKAHSLILPLRFVLAGNLLFAFLASLNVSLMWIQIAGQSNSFKRNTGDLAKQYRNLVICLEVVFAIAVFAAGVAGFFALTGFIALPFLLLVALTFVYGQWKIIPLMTQTSESRTNSAMTNLANRIRRTSRRMVILIFILVASAVSVSLTSTGGYKEVTPEGGISLYLVFNSASYAFISTLTFVVLLYVFGHLKKNMRSRSKLAAVGSFLNSPGRSRGSKIEKSVDSPKEFSKTEAMSASASL